MGTPIYHNYNMLVLSYVDTSSSLESAACLVLNDNGSWCLAIIIIGGQYVPRRRSYIFTHVVQECVHNVLVNSSRR